MKEPVRVAVVGCGGITGEHLRGYRTLREKGMEGFLVAAACDPVRVSAERFADRIAEFQESRPTLGSVRERMDGDVSQFQCRSDRGQGTL